MQPWNRVFADPCTLSLELQLSAMDTCLQLRFLAFPDLPHNSGLEEAYCVVARVLKRGLRANIEFEALQKNKDKHS